MSGEPYGGAPNPGVKNPLASSYQWGNISQQELDMLRSKLVESIIQTVVRDITGVLLPGPAGEQLADWALNVLTNTSIIAGSLIVGVTGVEQAILDAIANALGHTGTGHTPSDILSYLSAIPAAVITGVTTIEQAILDAVANALGHSGTGHTPTQVQTYLTAIPGTNLAGTVPAALISGTTAIEQAILDAIANALGHSGTGHTPADILGYLSNIPGSVISGVTTDLQSTLDAIANALGFAGLGHTAANVQTALGVIPGGNLTGALNTAVTVSGNPIGTLLTNLNSTGQFAASGLTGGINTAVTISGNAVSTLFNGSGLIASQITGALNTAVTVGGTSLATLIPGGQLAASQLTGAVNTAVTISGNAISTLFNSSGVLASQLTGGINTAVTFGGTALSTLFTNLNSTGQFAASGLTGALNTAVTISGTAVSTLLQYLNSSGQFNAAQITGALNTATTISGNALSTLFNGSGLIASQITGALNPAVTFLVGASNVALSTLLANINATGQFSAASLTGALNSAVTFSGTALSTLLQYLNSSGQFNAAQVTGAFNGAVTLGGISFTNLLQNLNSSGQLVGSAITGAINTSATIGGTVLSTLSTNWNAAVTNVNSLISNVGGTVIADVNTFLNTAATNAQGSLNAIVNGINNSAVTSQTITQAQTAVNQFISGVVNNLQGIAGTFGLTGATSANSAFAAAAAAQAAQAAQLAAQTSAFNAVFNVSPATAGNVTQTIDFTTMANASTLTGIMSPGTGPLGITSGEAAWQGTATGDTTEVFPTQTTTDYQSITFTLGSLNDILASGNAQIRFLGRCDSARTTHVYVALLNNGGNLVLTLGCNVTGTNTIFVSNVSLPTAATGGQLKLVLGDPSSSSPYAIQVLYNGTPAITYTDSSHVSQLGASYRYVGTRAINSFATYRPPAIRVANYQDNPPPPTSYPYSGLPTAGTKGRMYWPNDVGVAKRDNGTAWETVWGGVLGAFTEPPSSGWSTTTLGSATFAADKGARMLTLPASAGDTMRVEYRTLSPASNYIATAYIETTQASGNALNPGLVLRDGSGNLIHYGINYTTTFGGWCLAAGKWTSPTAFSAFYFGITIGTQTGLLSPPNWLRIKDDGTNRYFDYSYNGVDWITASSVGRTNFLTPTQIGWGGSNVQAGTTAVLRLRSFAGVS